VNENRYKIKKSDQNKKSSVRVIDQKTFLNVTEFILNIVSSGKEP
jgi:hypothetical protein